MSSHCAYDRCSVQMIFRLDNSMNSSGCFVKNQDKADSTIVVEEANWLVAWGRRELITGSSIWPQSWNFITSFSLHNQNYG